MKKKAVILNALLFLAYFGLWCLNDYLWIKDGQRHNSVWYVTGYFFYSYPAAVFCLLWYTLGQVESRRRLVICIFWSAFLSGFGVLCIYLFGIPFHWSVGGRL